MRREYDVLLWRRCESCPWCLARRPTARVTTASRSSLSGPVALAAGLACVPLLVGVDRQLRWLMSAA